MQQSFHHRLMKTYFAMHRCVMSAAKQLGLTSGQPKVLEFLREQEGVDQKTIAKNCEIESATVGSILDRMEKSGLIRRQRIDGNRRSLYVFLTDEGRNAAESTEVLFSAAEKIAFAGMDEKQRLRLEDDLEKIYAHLTAYGELK